MPKRGNHLLTGDHPVQGRYARMLASSATAAICAGPDNLIVSWNSAAEDLFGIPADQALGQPLSIIIPHRHRASHEAGLLRAARSGHARLAGQSVEMLALHADGSEIPIDLSLSMWLEGDRLMFGALVRDIRDRQAARARLEHLAHCDTLTSLPNRHAMNAKLAETVGVVPSALLLLDLDGFKQVNVTMGFTVGDELLGAVGARLAETAGLSGFVARLGGDEFGILFSGCDDPLVVDELARNILDCLKQPFDIAGQPHFVGTSIGIAMAPRDGNTAEKLLARADMALHSAKADGGGLRRFFVRTMLSQSEQRHRLMADLREAAANGELELWFQPQVALPDCTVAGVEALLRWRHPNFGLMPPQVFLSVLEHSALAEDIGDWIVDRACAAVAEWQRCGVGPVRVAVNLFPAQLRSGRLVEVVSAALARHAVPADLLEVEITENTVLRGNDQATEALARLKAMGVQVAFDDFGTGFASLSLLQKYPLDRLKIDRSFVARIDTDAGDAAIVGAVIAMARSLGLGIIAEGVETEAQERALVELGCGEAQGYRYGRALPMAQVTQGWLAAKAEGSARRRIGG